MSALEDALFWQLRVTRQPLPEREVCLIPGRRFRWDFVWREPQYRLTVEVQGGTWSKVRGAHSRGKGQARDAEKQALATLAGYRCLTVTSDQIRSGQALGWIAKALNGGNEAPQDGREAAGRPAETRSNAKTDAPTSKRASKRRA
jgi:hypothetical protein